MIHAFHLKTKASPHYPESLKHSDGIPYRELPIDGYCSNSSSVNVNLMNQTGTCKTCKTNSKRDSGRDLSER
jgi:hypothetical protein